MKHSSILRTGLICAAIIAVASIPGSSSLLDKETRLTVNETVEVPGGTFLAPGQYYLRLALANPADRNVVSIMDSDKEIITNAMTIPIQLPSPPDEPLFTFYETHGTEPEALKAWYYPGEKTGWQFLYSRERMRELAQRERMTPVAQTAQPLEINPVLTAKAEPEPEPLPAPEPAVAPPPAPQPEPEPVAKAEPEPVVTPEPEPEPREEVLLAQAQPAPQTSLPETLPQTASNTAAWAFFGLFTLGVAMIASNASHPQKHR